MKRYQVVLVGTKIPENIGATARLLENYAVGSAAWVNPQCEWKRGVAQWMATGPSQKRLNEIPVVASLSEAVKDSQFVVGFTARAGKTRKSSIQLESLGKKLKGNVSLVFGREDFCLLKEEIEVCTHLCALDTSTHFPALNLSHSVAVVLSQLLLQETDSRRGHHRITTVSEQEPMYGHLEQMLVSIGMNTGGNPKRILDKLKKIFQRAELTRQDISLLRGLYTQIEKKVTRAAKQG